MAGWTDGWIGKRRRLGTGQRRPWGSKVLRDWCLSAAEGNESYASVSNNGRLSSPPHFERVSDGTEEEG
jgi:hypothetical protein